MRDAQLNQALAAPQIKVRWFEPADSIAELVSYSSYRELWFDSMKAAIAPPPDRIVVLSDNELEAAMAELRRILQEFR